MPSPLRYLLSLLGLTALSSCAVLGPNFATPKEEVPAAYAGNANEFKGTGTPVVMNAGIEPDWHWWQEFKDPELDRLEQQAVSGNIDLQVALLRIVEARAQVQIARAKGIPSLTANASVNREQLGLAGILKAQGSNSALSSSSEASGVISSLTQPINLYQLGFDASWELDLFGKVARSVEASEAQSVQSIESRNDALVSLEAEVAQTYFQLRAAQMLREINLQAASDQREILELTINRQFSGLSSEASVESQRAQVASTESQLPQYDQTIAMSSHALAVLTGALPSSLDAELLTAGVLPPLPSSVGIGIPSELARRRPDIRQAEATLHAATAEIGVSVASMYPDITLSGTLGLRNVSTSYLFNWASKFYTFGPSVSLPIFEGGSLIANVRVSRAQAAEAALNYRKTVLSALQEVEDGLTSLHDDGLRVASLQESVSANQRSVALSVNSYRSGLSTYIDVLTAESQTIQAQNQLDSALLSESTDLVKLFKALGGGWQNSAPTADQPGAALGTIGTAGLGDIKAPELAPR